MLYKNVGIISPLVSRKSKEFRLWSGIISRCYSKKEQIRKPTYVGCEMSENFKNYEYFYNWCHNQIGFGLANWDIDKDLLSQDNKIYSEDLCIFIPHEVNTFLTIRHRFRGECPVGVDKRENGSFRVRVNINGDSVCLGHFKDKISAFIAYKKAKEDNAKKIAEKWKDHIDPRAYEALIQYTVEITD